ncbi:hexaprenyldihydroxybenzoate methyltransferase [Fistulina hepatica ATCC 64428]|uniref:Hexaprenyldihydroxybenzoate methyltransferase n=1 Tax=Fistulina hepatica ATCC 64428 TaxID=1128425 RepID=A0A0D7A2Q2_9AGAR|nr:hexaprenyldihydroxybenzoate methyltransferase [Fistulina hepatica ATCC 64428]
MADSTHDYAQANKAHFDDIAKDYQQFADAIPLAKTVTDVMLKSYAFDASTTTVLDFACGTGHISKCLAPHALKVLGVDISRGMVDQYNAALGGNCKAIAIELRGQEGELDGEKFDVIVCSAAYHHFASPAEMTKMLVSFLKPSGALLVADFINLPKPPAGYQHENSIVAHHGFSEQDMRGLYEGAGLQLASFDRTAAVLFGSETTIFVAKGVRKN